MYRSTLLSVLLGLLVPIASASAVPEPNTQGRSYGHKAGINHRSAQEVIHKLNLEPNVEKGYYIETFQDPDTSANNRSASTAIYYLLEGSVGPSVWHRIDAVEVWHYYAGAPLVLSLSKDDGNPVVSKTLGPDIFEDQIPQVVIEKEQWQRARSLGAWTLVGTTVAPGFVASGSELAEPGWSPKGA